MRFSLALTMLLLTACGPDETISGYADNKATYVLRTLENADVAPRMTIQFPEEGQVAGQSACNRYTATQSAPYPWFEIKAIAATRRACPDLDLETAYFQALEQMTFAEVVGDVLILSNSADDQLVFQAE